MKGSFWVLGFGVECVGLWVLGLAFRLGVVSLICFELCAPTLRLHGSSLLGFICRIL